MLLLSMQRLQQNSGLMDTFCFPLQEEKLPEASMMRILRFNSPEWLYIVVGLFSAALVGAQNPCFAILFAEFLDVSFLTFST